MLVEEFNFSFPPTPNSNFKSIPNLNSGINSKLDLSPPLQKINLSEGWFCLILIKELQTEESSSIDKTTSSTLLSSLIISTL